ncbi:hypothetical protein DB346_19410 [Verrucomicrobia bacterium LW23]|nr:hypothetical protein DB346_19410 [Verrucomicrobia bacterium LW23]
MISPRFLSPALAAAFTAVSAAAALNMLAISMMPISASHAQGAEAAQVTAPEPGQPVIRDGEAIGFMGDSITQAGAASPSGYVQLVISGLKANGINVKSYPAGTSGNKSDQMLGRLKGLLDKKPTWITLSCGVNDVWHGPKGIPLDQYKENITKFVDQCQAAGVKVMILTATMIMESQDGKLNNELVPYNDFLRTLAKEKKCLLADLNADMQKEVAELKAAGLQGNTVTGDGVHMNPAGNLMMAKGVLRAFGLNDEQMKKAMDHWLDIPHACEVKAGITLREYLAIQDAAAKAKKSTGQVLNKSVKVKLDVGDEKADKAEK